MNLTTLANVSAWLPQIAGTTASNPLLNQLIQRCSSHILAYLQRPDILQTSFTDYFNDLPPSGRLMLRNWPVVSVSAVQIGSMAIPAQASQGQPGYVLEKWNGSLPGVPQRVGIIGYRNSYQNVGYDSGGQLVAYRGSNTNAGFQSISVAYTGGYAVAGETQTIPAVSTYTITPNQPYGIWSGDNGVMYSSTGIALTAISSGIPTIGQYLPPQPWAASPTTVYTFAAADEGKGVTLNYSFIPYALEQACIEWIGERFKYRDRIGFKTQNMSGMESVSYNLVMPDAIKMMLEPYCKKIPL